MSSRLDPESVGAAVVGVFIAVLFVLAVAVCCGVLPALLIASIR